MGWKSTIDITREEAITLIKNYILSCDDNKLETILENLGFGDNSDLPYFGYNFIITNEKSDGWV